MLEKFFSFLHTHRTLCIVTALLWTIIIFIGCSLPGRELPSVHIFEHFDKVVHFTFFFVFYLLWRIAKSKIAHIGLWLVAISFLYGFALEFYQVSFVAGRSFDVWDGVADTLGAVVAHVCFNRKLFLIAM